MTRKSAESWTKSLIEDIRSNPLLLDESSPVYIIATHKDHNEELLVSEVAAALLSY